MRKFLPALAFGFVLLTSFTTDKQIEETQGCSVTEASSCYITVVSITRYVCGDVYEGSSSYYDPLGDCGSYTYYEVTPGQDNGICTHDHSAPPDGVK